MPPTIKLDMSWKNLKTWKGIRGYWLGAVFARWLYDLNIVVVVELQ
jgi:hypothetical protein